MSAQARPRNDFADDFQRALPMETVGKSVVQACLNAAIDQSGVPAKVLADGIGVSEGEFSKLRAGRFRTEQIDRLPDHIQADWRDRMDRAAGAIDREAAAVERLAHAAIDVLAIVKGKRMAKASIR